jgi:hypothetical protein
MSPLPFHERYMTPSNLSPNDMQWDAFVGNWSGASFFHTSTWSRVLQDAYGYRSNNLVVRHASEVRGLLPMMEVRSAFTGNRGVSLPFTDSVDALCHDHSTFAELFQSAVDMGIARNWKYLEFRGRSSFFPAAVRPSVSFYTHNLALSPDVPGVLTRMDASVRRAIRKAESSGVTIEFSRSIDAVREFYILLSRTRQRHGVPPQPFSFFENIQRHVLAQDKGWIVLAKHRRMPIAGAVFFHFGPRAVYKYGASNDAHQNLRGNNLVMWNAVQHYANAGVQTLDFGRTSLRNDGLRRFKLGWGTAETQINYFKYNIRTRQFTTSRDESTGWYNRVFTALPRTLSRLIGTLLYKHIG